MDLNSIPEQHHLRVQELMIILRSVKIDWLDKEPHHLSISLSNFLTWTKELLDLVGEKKYTAFMLEAVRQKVQPISTPNQSLNSFLEPSTYQQLTQFVEQYQTSPAPLQDRNYDGQFYHSSYLSNRIKLLYQIGKLVNLLPQNETFGDYTKVTQKTQVNCNQVCNWLRINLQIELAQLNVYEPFLFDYCMYSHLQAKNLKEIGIRAGLLEEKAVLLGEKVDDDRKISPADARTVIGWLKETYGISLPFPESYQLTSEVNFPSFSNSSTERRGKNNVANAISVTIVLVVLFAAFNQFYSFVNSNQQKYDFGQENSKLTPHLKAKHATSKKSN